MRKFFILFFLSFFLSFLSAEEAKVESYLDIKPKTENEALFFRRIVEFWNEQSYELVESQIQEFIKTFPDSELCDSFFALLGDLHSYQNHYQKALQAYEKIISSEVQAKILLKRLRCLRNLNQFYELIQILSPYLEVQKHPQDLEKELLYLGAESYYQLCKTSEGERQKEYAENGIKVFERLLNTDVNSQVVVSLAYLHRVLEDYPRAADLYLLASRKTSDEELLFHAANLQVKYDKELAIQTFSQLCRIGKNYVNDAAWNRLILMYETKKFGEIILAKDQLQRQISEDKAHLLPYFLGRSYFELEDYSRCKSALTDFVKQSNVSQEELKQSYLTLIECARIDEDLSTFDIYFSHLREKFPEAREIGDTLLVRALLHRKKHYFQEAKKDFEVIVAKYPEIGEKALLEYEYARTLYDIENWVECRNAFKQFVETFKEHPYRKKAWIYLIQASINHAEYESTNDPFARDQLAFDLEQVFEEKQIIDEMEREKYEFLLAKTNYEIQAYEEAINYLEKFLRVKRSPEKMSDATLLLAFCYKKSANKLGLFCDMAEKALRGPITIMEESQVHLELYNTYLKRLEGVNQKSLFVQKRGKEIFLVNKEHYQNPHLIQAAEHLYLAYKTGGHLKLDNLIWLVDYFLDEYKKDQHQTFLIRSKDILESILFKNEKIIQFNPQNLHLEVYVLKLVHLLEEVGDFEKSREILVQLYSQQTLHHQFSWKTKDEALYLLGQKTLKSDKKRALGYFEEILNKSKSLTEPKVAEACLWHARVHYQLLDSTKKLLENPEIQSILSKLKSLYIQRILDQEPVHLEAAYDYIEIKSCLVNEEIFDRMRLDLLEKTIVNFITTEDVLSKDYHTRRKQLPKKDQIYQLYLKFFKAEVSFCKSRLAKKTGHKQDEQIYENEAMRAYDELKNESQLTQYLRGKIDERLHQLS